MHGSARREQPASASGFPLGAARWLVLGEWRHHPARLVIGVLAIAVGVALGFAVHLVNRTALDSFDRAVRSVNGGAELQVRAATPAGFDESLYPRIARITGVGVASPVVELAASAQMAGGGTGGRAFGNRLTVIGIDMLRAIRATPALVGMPLAGGPGTARASGTGFDGDSMFASRAALRLWKAAPGARVTLTAAGITRRFTVAGVLAGAGDDEPLAVIDIADAQWRFGQLGRLQRIDLQLVDGTDSDARAAILAAIRTALPPGATLVSPQSEARRSDSLSRAYRVNLEMLAMVALLTGGFLVFSAQALSVARRRPQFALLRVLGLPRGSLVRQVVAEGAILGVAGAALGVVLGYGLAALALAVLGGDLGGGYFGRGAAAPSFPWGAAMVFGLIGLTVAVASSLWPAVEAGRAAPAVALKQAGDAGDPRKAPRGWPGLALLAAGGIAALGPPLWGLPLLGYLAMALLLAGGVAAMPWFVRALLVQVHGRAAWPPLHLALERLWGAPGSAAVALCGIVASTSLMVAMAVMVTSFRGSVDDWLVQLLPSDVYLHIEGADAGGLNPADQARLAATPGVASMRFVRQLPMRLAADKPQVMLNAEPIDPENAGARLPLIGATAAIPPGAIPVWVSEPMVWLYGVHPGDWLQLPLGGGKRLFVAGVWRDYARQFGAVAMVSGDYQRLTGDASRGEAAVDLLPGARPAVVIRALQARLPPGLAGTTRFAEPRQLRALALRLFDRSFAITYALEAIAIGIGLIGVATTFSAQTLARRREFGMLRHIGVRRGEVTAMLATEGALLGALGVVAGLGLGVLMAQVLIHVVNPQSFHWTMNTRIPWGLFGSLAVALVAAAAGTAMLAGRRALSADAVNAVRQDW
jgi:putative ABC transport system permease protein